MSCPSSIWRQDSNPRPLERESTPITTRPGLPPLNSFIYLTLGLLVLAAYIARYLRWDIPTLMQSKLIKSARKLDW